MRGTSTVFIVDQDRSFRDTVRDIVDGLGLDSQLFTCGSEFIDGYDAALRGCLVAELLLPDMTTPQLLMALRDRDVEIPTIVATADSEVAMAVAAMRAGAITCLRKPCCPGELASLVREAIRHDLERSKKKACRREIQQRLDCLTADETKTMNMVIQGVANKVIARRLNVSMRTVEARRQRVLWKMGVDTAPELAQLVTWYRGDAPVLLRHLEIEPDFQTAIGTKGC